VAGFDRPLTTKWIKEFIHHASRNKLIIRTFLQKSEDFKATLENTTLNPYISTYYQNMKLPEYIWLIEVSYPEIFCQQRLRCGEMIIDPTGDPRIEECYLAIHLPSLFIVRDPDTEKTDFLPPIDADNPYKHIIRS
jgi:hypothetical protein